MKKKFNIRNLNYDEREYLGEVFYNFIYKFHRCYSLLRDIGRKLYVVKVYELPNSSELIFHHEVKSLKELKSVLFNYLERNC